MDLAEIRAELEDELGRRLDEIRFFKNQLSSFSSEEEQELFCKSLIVMLYAHFEGFWKAAFGIYVRSINQERLSCRDVVGQIAAASMNRLFKALANPKSKSDFFRKNAPDDSKLHRFARHSEFAERLPEALEKEVRMDVDELVDTESNLTPVVIRKNLYRLGFSHEEFKDEESKINELLRRRNDIAHGSSQRGVPVATYTTLETAILSIMNKIVVLIFDSLRDRRFVQRSAAS